MISDRYIDYNTTHTIDKRCLKLTDTDRPRMICIDGRKPLPQLWICTCRGSLWLLVRESPLMVRMMRGTTAIARRWRLILVVMLLGIGATRVHVSIDGVRKQSCCAEASRSLLTVVIRGSMKRWLCLSGSWPAQPMLNRGQSKQGKCSRRYLTVWRNIWDNLKRTRTRFWLLGVGHAFTLVTVTSCNMVVRPSFLRYFYQNFEHMDRQCDGHLELRLCNVKPLFGQE